MPSEKQRNITGPTPGTPRSARTKRRQMDANIREIFEEEGRKSDALRKAIQYMFENDPIIAVHAYLKLLSTQNTASPVRNVTNVFAEQVNAQRIVGHLEDLVRATDSHGCAASVQNEPVLLVDDRSETH